MSNDFIPPTDDGFATFEEQFAAEVEANGDADGITAAEKAALKTASAKFKLGLQAHKDAQKAAKIACEAKDQDRKDLTAVIRPIVRGLNGNVGITNEKRKKYALVGHDTVRSHIGAPTTRPLLRTEHGGPATLLVHVADETTPHSIAKPHGAVHCELWEFMGDVAPVDPSGYAKTATISRMPHTDRHAAADAGKTVHLMGRWLTQKGLEGPWSAVVTTKIPV